MISYDKINWTKYVDAIYCLHFLPHKDRLKKIETTLNYLDILNSPIFHWYYTYPNAFDEMIVNSIKPSQSDYYNERRIKVANINIAYHNMFREAQELGYKKVIVIENDCSFIYERKPLFIETLEHLPEEWDYIHFDKLLCDKSIVKYLSTLQYGTWFHSNYTGGYWGTAFTMWSKKAMDYVIKVQEKNLSIIDSIFSNNNSSEINEFKRFIPKYSFIYQSERITSYAFS